MFGFRLAGYRAIGGCDIDNKSLKLFKKYHKPTHVHHKPLKKILASPQLLEQIKEADTLLLSPAMPSMSSINNGAPSNMDDCLSLIDLTRPSTLAVFTDNSLSYQRYEFYLKKIISKLNNLGYDAKSYFLNTADFGIAQKQESTVIIASNKINTNPLELIPTTPDANKKITVEKAFTTLDQEVPLPTTDASFQGHEMISKYNRLVNKGGNYGQVFQQLRNVRSYTNWTKLDDKSPSFKLTELPLLTHYNEPRFLTLQEYLCLSSFPRDIVFSVEQDTNLDIEQAGKYFIGSSIPPFLAMYVAQAMHRAYYD